MPGAEGATAGASSARAADGSPPGTCAATATQRLRRVRVHSPIEFSVRHMGLSTVRGRFKAFGGTVATDDEDRPTAVSVDIETTSIDTNAVDRDARLRNPDFFDAAAHPAIRFRTTALRAVGGERFEVAGDMPMNGVTHAVILDVEIGDPIRNPWGQLRRAAVGA